MKHWRELIEKYIGKTKICHECNKEFITTDKNFFQDICPDCEKKDTRGI